MIDFACKQFKMEEIIKCGLGLSKADCKIFTFLLENDETFKTEEIAEKLEFNLSTVQRAVKKLHEKGILMRKQTNVSGGGFYYNYEIKSRKDIKVIIMEVIHSWVNSVESEFDSWDRL